MIVYEPLSVTPYELCHPVDENDFKTIHEQINGQSRQAVWKPIAVKLVHEDEGQVLLPSDSPWLASDALVFRPSAIAVIGSLLRDYGELLPLQCSGAELWVFNCTRVVDALNEEASTLNRFDDGRIMWIRRHVFRPAVLRGVEIFKLANLPASSTYVGQRFVDMWQAAGLKGLQFPPVWVAN